MRPVEPPQSWLGSSGAARAPIPNGARHAGWPEKWAPARAKSESSRSGAAPTGHWPTPGTSSALAVSLLPIGHPVVGAALLAMALVSIMADALMGAPRPPAHPGSDA